MTAVPTRERRARTSPRAVGLRLLPGGGCEVSGRFTREPQSRGEVLSIGLLAVDHDFAEAIPPADHPIAAAIRLPRLVLEPGAWQGPPTQPDTAAPAGMLVLDGLVSRSIDSYGRPTIELYGPGDVVGSDEGSDDSPAAAVTWHVHQPSSLADLDRRFAIAATRWPALWHVPLRRCSMRANRLAAQLAALQLSRVDDRLEAVLWQLANRWGRVTPEGVVVPLTLNHEMLGRLTAAKRPTVSVALSALGESGRVTRRADGTWLLARPSQAVTGIHF